MKTVNSLWNHFKFSTSTCNSCTGSKETALSVQRHFKSSALVQTASQRENSFHKGIAIFAYFQFYILLIVISCVYHTVCLWRSEDKLKELVLSFCVGPRDQTQVSGLTASLFTHRAVSLERKPL